MHCTQSYAVLTGEQTILSRIICLLTLLEFENLGPMEVQSSSRHKRNEHDYEKLRRALCVGYGNQLAERMLHHNGYRTLGYRSQLVQVHNFRSHNLNTWIILNRSLESLVRGSTVIINGLYYCRILVCYPKSVTFRMFYCLACDALAIRDSQKRPKCLKGKQLYLAK